MEDEFSDVGTETHDEVYVLDPEHPILIFEEGCFVRVDEAFLRERSLEHRKYLVRRSRHRVSERDRGWVNNDQMIGPHLVTDYRTQPVQNSVSWFTTDQDPIATAC